MPIILKGATSGQVTLDTPAIAGTNNLELPAATGTIQLLKLETAQATTSGTFKDFTGIPSWAKKITVLFNGVSTNGTSALIVQTGSGSFDTSGYSSIAFIGTSTPAIAAMNATNGHLCDNTRLNQADTSIGSVVFTQIATNTWSSAGLIYRNNAVTAVSMVTGFRTTSSTLDRIRLTTVNGTDTFDAGSVNILIEGN